MDDVSNAAASLHERDFLAWSEDQAMRLRRLAAARADLDLDLENLAEEVESMGRSDLKAAESAVVRIIEHLLKLQFSPATEPRGGWECSVDEQRQALRREIKSSPSLLRRLDLDELYADGLRLASRGMERFGESGAARSLPARCPYTLAQVRDPDWWPERLAGAGRSSIDRSGV